MAAAAGVLLFAEPVSLLMAAGVVLTIVGLSLMKGPVADDSARGEPL